MKRFITKTGVQNKIMILLPGLFGETKPCNNAKSLMYTRVNMLKLFHRATEIINQINSSHFPTKCLIITGDTITPHI